MGYEIYKVGERWGGYGVPAICEYPGCNKIINRGMSYACGGEPFSELGCDRYFCSKHKNWVYINPLTGKKCRHKKDDCGCEDVELCERCANGKEPFPYKPELSKWLRHLLKHSSWKTWREENPREVEKIKKELEDRLKVKEI